MKSSKTRGIHQSDSDEKHTIDMQCRADRSASRGGRKGDEDLGRYNCASSGG